MKPKYIKSAIAWNRWAGDNGAWVRISDLNLINYKHYGERYTPAQSGVPLYLYKDVYPYEAWMEEYIGTNKDLRKDKEFTYDY